ncbi:Mitochondrial polypeptide chain release factor [Ceraceosorus bombacis]|uniref:Mitochondrial polypeptide chain release factor n=1 Tax=Ceraceosorus bombacis TaxID=401625 RepID=A0A0P1BB15_9BASI|nr:Mitochondrial polypeptide chain release factor [Ceraceosorus bombacis]
MSAHSRSRSASEALRRRTSTLFEPLQHHIFIFLPPILYLVSVSHHIFIFLPPILYLVSVSVEWSILLLQYALNRLQSYSSLRLGRILRVLEELLLSAAQVGVGKHALALLGVEVHRRSLSVKPELNSRSDEHTTSTSQGTSSAGSEVSPFNSSRAWWDPSQGSLYVLCSAPSSTSQLFSLRLALTLAARKNDSVIIVLPDQPLMGDEVGLEKVYASWADVRKGSLGRSQRGESPELGMGVRRGGKRRFSPTSSWTARIGLDTPPRDVGAVIPITASVTSHIGLERASSTVSSYATSHHLLLKALILIPPSSSPHPDAYDGAVQDAEALSNLYSTLEPLLSRDGGTCISLSPCSPPAEPTNALFSRIPRVICRTPLAHPPKTLRGTFSALLFSTWERSKWRGLGAMAREESLSASFSSFLAVSREAQRATKDAFSAHEERRTPPPVPRALIASILRCLSFANVGTKRGWRCLWEERRVRIHLAQKGFLPSILACYALFLDLLAMLGLVHLSEEEQANKREKARESDSKDGDAAAAAAAASKSKRAYIHSPFFINITNDMTYETFGAVDRSVWIGVNRLSTPGQKLMDGHASADRRLISASARALALSTTFPRRPSMSPALHARKPLAIQARSNHTLIPIPASDQASRKAPTPVIFLTCRRLDILASIRDATERKSEQKRQRSENVHAKRPGDGPPSWWPLPLHHWAVKLSKRGWQGFMMDLDEDLDWLASEDNVEAETWMQHGASELSEFVRGVSAFPPLLIAHGAACLVAEQYVASNPVSGLILHDPPLSIARARERGLIDSEEVLPVEEPTYEPRFATICTWSAAELKRHKEEEQVPYYEVHRLEHLREEEASEALDRVIWELKSDEDADKVIEWAEEEAGLAAGDQAAAPAQECQDLDLDVNALLREVEADEQEARDSESDEDAMPSEEERQEEAISAAAAADASASANAACARGSASKARTLPSWFDESMGYRITSSSKEPILIPPSHLIETFIRGSGPGGQAINKLSTNVSLLHKPSGTRITCQETRSRETNRMLARRKMSKVIDGIVRGEQSAERVKREKERRKALNRKKKSKRKYRALKEAQQE